MLGVNVPYRWLFTRKDYKEKPLTRGIQTLVLWWGNLVYLCQSIKWIIQRGFRGYGDCDTWNIDGYLAGVLPLMLKRLDREDVPIDKIIEGFEAARRILEVDYDGVDWKEQCKADIKVFKKGIRLFGKHYFELWD